MRGNKRVLFAFYFLLLMLFAPVSASAQERPPEVPDDADVSAGLTIYQERCAACHGPQGLGDGQLAAQAVNRPTPIGDPDYLATADLAMMFETIQNGNIAAGMPGFGEGNNSNPLSDDDIWNVLAALYEFPRLNEPIDAAVVSGEINNFTTGDAITSGTALLQGFDPAFNEALTLETEITADGRYQFDLQNISPLFLYRVIVEYDGLEFSSDFGQMSVLQPELELEVGVYEQVSDPAVIRLSQVDTVVEFVTDDIRVSQLYVVDNAARAVFVGEDGTFDSGTVTVSIPAGAQNIAFLRQVGSGATDFVPIDDLMVQRTATDWGVALPITSGAGAFRLLAQYELPYEGGIIFSHPLYYPATVPSLILQDPSITVVDEVWSAALGGIQTNEFARYQRPALSSGETLQFSLSGSPSTFIDEQGNMVAFRNEQQELLIGGVALAAVLAIAIYFVYQWRMAPPAENERDTLLRTLAALDEAHATGRLRKSTYQRERKRIKERLLTIWES